MPQGVGCFNCNKIRIRSRASAFIQESEGLIGNRRALVCSAGLQDNRIPALSLVQGCLQSHAIRNRIASVETTMVAALADRLEKGQR